MKFERYAFCFFIFSKWKRYCNLNFNDTFKMCCCCVVHYGNLNSSSINKPFLNYGPSLFYFSDFLFVFILIRLYHTLYHFWNKFSKSTSGFSILLNIRMPKLVILKWWSFEYKGKCEKTHFLFRSVTSVFETNFKRLYEERFEDLQINSCWKIQTRPTMSHKMTAL